MSITIHKNLSNVSIQFDNGYIMSINIGSNAYCTPYSVIDSHYSGDSISAQNAEIAIIDPDSEFHRIAGQDDDVVGWVSPEKIVEIAYRVACGDMDAVAKILKH